MQSFSRFILRRAGLVALVGTFLSFLGIYWSIALFKNLRTNIEELLPTTARSVIDLDEVSRRLQSIDSLGILIFTDNSEAGKRFQTDLATRLATLPKDVLSSTEYKIDQELQFFKDRQALYMDAADLRKIRGFIGEKINYETELYNPLNIFNEKDIPEPKLDFNALRSKYEGRMSAYERFPEGYYATPNGKIRIVLANMPGKTSSIEQVHALKDATLKVVSELNPKKYAPDLEVKYTGGVQNTLEEHEALMEDLLLSTIVVAVLVTLAMWAFYRTALATFALVVSLFMGTFWTFGASYFLVGYLNANSAFLGSIVIGNGINFGIIFLARYLEERRNGQINEAAIQSAMTHTARATWTAALAAGLSYGSLMLTSFRGFSQFGVIGLTGMVLCWASSFTLLPAYLTVLDRITPLVKPGGKPVRPIVSELIARLVGRFAKPICVISAIVTVASLILITQLDKDILETNLGNLRNKKSLESGSSYLSRYQDEIFQRYLSPIAILPHSREDALRIAALLKEKKAAQGEKSLLASVATIDDFIPTDQAEKIKTIQEIRALLPQRLLVRLSDHDRNLIKRFLNPAALQPVTMDSLPALVREKFTERDGSIGKLVLVEPPLQEQTWQGDNLIRFIADIRESADQIAPGTAVAGGAAITSDMLEAISRDGPRATLFAFLAVVLLVVVLFRHVVTITQILAALVIGMVWLFGFIVAHHFKINFLNFIALPITFGIGVDYGVNMFERYRHEVKETGRKDILHVIRQTGGAVMLCSLSTIIGYGSLLIASNQGFVSFGTLAIMGEITCLVAAIVTIPALLILQNRSRLKSVKSNT